MGSTAASDGFLYWALRNSRGDWPVIPETRRAAGIALILFFIAVLPANIHGARASVTLRGRPATSLWLRIPMQILFIVLAWWSTW